VRGRLRFYATRPEPIRIAGTLSRLHFLQATTFPVDTGSEVGRYRLKYEDGSVANLPLVYGRNIRSWTALIEEPSELPEARIVWTGTNRTAIRDRSERRLGLWTWTNPNPDRLVRSVELEADPQSRAVPFLVGITAEQTQRTTP